jgi:hypothetical protein
MEIDVIHRRADDSAEAYLGSHDMAVQCSERGDGLFRFILVSSIDVGNPCLEKKLESLYQMEGGRQCGIIFLLDNSEKDHPASLASLAALQIK